jgi:hypothetical protein
MPTIFVTDRRNLVHTLLTLAALALALTLAALFLIALASPAANAQAVRHASHAKPADGPADKAADRAADAPLYTDYRGVRLGATAEEVRAKLCKAVSESDQEDFHVVSETETAQVFYDAARKVRAVTVSYTSGGPTAEAVFGRPAETREDGSQHLKVNYERAGYWVAYTRTAGDSPVVMIVMQANRR